MISQQYDTPLYKLPWWEKAQSEKLEAAKAKREARKLTRRPCPASLLPADLVKASSSCASAVATPAVADVEAPAVDAVALGGFEQHTVAVVPEGISPGKIFEVHDATSQMTFPTSCPPDAAPGDEILVTLPNFLLDFCTFVPNDHESDFRALVERVGEEMLMADFEALSVETVSIRGGAHYLNRTKFWIAESPWRSRDNTGYQKEPHYQFIRVWYNSLLARNRTERAMSMLRKAKQNEEYVKERDSEHNGGCYYMVKKTEGETDEAYKHPGNQLQLDLCCIPGCDSGCDSNSRVVQVLVLLFFVVVLLVVLT